MLKLTKNIKEEARITTIPAGKRVLLAQNL
jgi:hypothetical protein